MTGLPAKLKFVTRFGYGDALPTDEPQEGPYRVFGSNGPYASFSRANTEAPAIIVGRKGSYGKVNWTSAPCFASDTTFFVDSSTTRHNLRWVYWLLQTLHLDEGTDEAAVPGLNRETAYSREVLVPPLPQQRAIADYLDRETGQLDALVAAKERLSTLLAEKRRALITRSVTRGLDLEVSTRDSGLPWLGEVPAHWGIIKLKHIAAIYYGLSQPPPYVLSGIPFLRATNVERGQLGRDGLVFVNEVDLPDSRVVRLRAGDIIVVRSGAYTGDSALVTEEWSGAVAGYDMVARVQPPAMPEFVALAFLCEYVLEAQINPLRLRAAQPHLNAEELGDISIALPPVDEQNSIVAHIVAETARLDALAAATERSIKLLGERRAALIAAAVMGQIKVT